MGNSEAFLNNNLLIVTYKIEDVLVDKWDSLLIMSWNMEAFMSKSTLTKIQEDFALKEMVTFLFLDIVMLQDAPILRMHWLPDLLLLVLMLILGMTINLGFLIIAKMTKMFLITEFFSLEWQAIIG